MCSRLGVLCIQALSSFDSIATPAFRPFLEALCECLEENSAYGMLYHIKVMVVHSDTCPFTVCRAQCGLGEAYSHASFLRSTHCKSAHFVMYFYDYRH